MAPIKVGDTLPNADLFFFDSDNQKQKVTTHEWASGKKVILFGVPGAFTPTCSLKHVPGFIEHADELKKHVDSIACVSVNDPFVMREWEKSFPDAKGKVSFFADGSAAFAKALGFEIDLSEHGLGIRSRRFSLLSENNVVKILHLEEGGAFTTSGASDILKQLHG